MAQSPVTQFSGIFISYRRDDSSGHAGRLFDNLAKHFGEDQIFMDIDTIDPGEDFEEVIERAVGACEIVIAVIGQRWLSAGDGTSRRLDNPNDFVRLEIAIALRRNIRVIPVLVQRATMPRPQDLPEDIATLARRNAIEISDGRWRHDITKLINVLEKVLAAQQESRLAEVARKAEEERLQQEAQTRKLEKERLRRAEQEEAARRAEAQRREEANRASADKRSKPPPSIETVRSPARESVGKGLTTDLRGVVVVQEATAQRAARNRTPMIVIASLAGVIVLVLIGLVVRGALNKIAKSGPNQAGVEFVLIQPGSFLMGSTNGKAGEKPAHQVTIGYSFYIGKYEVTQAQWQSVMGNNPSHFKECGGNCPVESVSWNDAQDFVNKLNEANDGFKYRLPSEAEWEYACRAGSKADHYARDFEIGWYADNSGKKTHPVGRNRVNAFGLYDMAGNVWEWCEDWSHPSYDGAPEDGSAWLRGGNQEYRIVRGGSWNDDSSFLRSAQRYEVTPDLQYVIPAGFGFRLVAVARTQ